MPEPTKIPRPFADSGDKNSIPDSSGGLGFASWQEGFPAITGTPFAQGGVAPKRADFNGIFNALSAATVWAQQGGVYAYDATTDYEVGNITEKSGIIYICKTANGPSSAVKDPAADTAETYWARVYPQSGTFNRMFFSQTSGSYTAPATGVYRITLKGGGGGGGGLDTAYNAAGTGGGEGCTVVAYMTLTNGQSYLYTIGAGGTAGTTGAGTQSGGGNGGTSTFNGISATGGLGGAKSDNFTKPSGFGGASYTIPTGVSGYHIPGASGQSGGGVYHYNGDSYGYSLCGGGNGGGNGQYAASMGGGGAGAAKTNNTIQAQSGGDGYILIEYAG